MFPFLTFVMITALFVHTFSNFLLGVYANVKKAVSSNPAAATAVASLEDLVGKVLSAVWTKIAGLFKKA